MKLEPINPQPPVINIFLIDLLHYFLALTNKNILINYFKHIVNIYIFIVNIYIFIVNIYIFNVYNNGLTYI